MSRNSSRDLIFILVLVAGLGLALPATAAPAERTPESPLLSRFRDWTGSLWDSVLQGKPNPWTILIEADSGADHKDRGILIDPNGAPGGK